MDRITFLVTCFCIAIVSACYANEVDYSNCGSIQDVIARESREIHNTNPADHEELAQLFVSRGESYLLDAQYEKAVEDFHNANAHLGYSHDVNAEMVVAFRAAFGEVVSYDNLGMQEQTQEAIQQLQTISSHMSCSNCADNHPCQGMPTPSLNTLHFSNTIKLAKNSKHFSELIVACKKKKDTMDGQEQEQSQDNYNDILGPNEPPDPDWCEEIVTGVGRAMDAIACLAPSYSVKVALIGVIEALITRGVKCCQAGGFWKACVAPITRKWKDWKNKRETPNQQNLHMFTDFVFNQLRNCHEKYIDQGADFSNSRHFAC